MTFDPEALYDEVLHGESGYDVFWSYAAENFVRTFTGKKANKVERDTRAMEQADEMMKDGISGQRSRRVAPPTGRTLLKQLFAGQAGLTFLAAVVFGYVVAEPLDIQWGWDGTTRDGRFEPLP